MPMPPTRPVTEQRLELMAARAARRFSDDWGLVYPEDVPDLIAALRAARARFQEEAAALHQYEEDEAACCPEDVGFPEFIAALKKRCVDGTAELLRLRARIDWLEADRRRVLRGGPPLASEPGAEVAG